MKSPFCGKMFLLQGLQPFGTYQKFTSVLANSNTITDAYSEPCQSSKMELFAKIVNGLTVNYFAKSSILDVWQGSENTCSFL